MSDFVSDGQMLNVDKVDTGTPSGPADTYALAAEWNSVNQAAMDLRTHVLALEAGGGGSVTVGTFGSTPNANGASASGSTLTLQPADGTHPGLLTSGAQTIGGAKTLTGALVGTSGTFSGGVDLSGVTSGNNAISLGGTSSILMDTSNAHMVFAVGGSRYLQVDSSGTHALQGILQADGSASIHMDGSNGRITWASGRYLLSDEVHGTLSFNSFNVAVATAGQSYMLGANNPFIINTAPTISAGSGAAVVANNGTVCGRMSLGAAAGTATVTLPAATTGWVIYAQDITTPGIKLKQTGSSTTTVTLTSYSETTGTATNWTASDNMVFIAFAY